MKGKFLEIAISESCLKSFGDASSLLTWHFTLADHGISDEIETKAEKEYSTMLYDALYYKHDIQLYSFKISGTSALKIDRELNIYKELAEKDLYIVMMFFKPFCSSQYIMEILQKFFEKDCLGTGAFMGGVYIIFKKLKKQKGFVDIINNLIKFV